MGEEVNQMVRVESGAGPISKLHNNKQRSLGPEWSMSEVGTPPPHNMDKPHGMVTSNNYNVRQFPHGIDPF